MIGLIEGRMVHFVDDAGQHNAATIVHVHSAEGLVNLFVPPRSASGASYVVEKKPFSSRKHIGTWHWPERVEE
jgi:hypothetical protein